MNGLSWDLAAELPFFLLRGTCLGFGWSYMSAEAGGILPLSSSPIHITDR